MVVCLSVYLFGDYRPTRDFSLIWRRHHCQRRTANFDLCSALMAFEQCHTYCDTGHPFIMVSLTDWGVDWTDLLLESRVTLGAGAGAHNQALATWPGKRNVEILVLKQKTIIIWKQWSLQQFASFNFFSFKKNFKQQTKRWQLWRPLILNNSLNLIKR